MTHKVDCHCQNCRPDLFMGSDIDTMQGPLPKPVVPWVEVDKETAYGRTTRLSFSIRVF